jgi:hypothetical protein
MRTFICIVVLFMSLLKANGQDSSRPPREDPRKSKIVPRGNIPSPGGKQEEHGDLSRDSLFSRSPQLLRGDLNRSHAKLKEGSGSVFQLVESALEAGNIGALSQHLGTQVFLNLRGGESGYYSANQAYYVLENYFKNRKLVQIDLTTMSESEATPYATGRAAFNVKGSREHAQIYLSLTMVGGRWVVTQINVY